jgi:ADP-heptose:LPS heptosyltransferase
MDWLGARNLLVVRMDNAGDVVMLGPALRAIKQASPGARLTLLASPAGEAIAPLLPWIDEVITWRAIWQDLGQLPFDPAREMVLIDQLRERGFDAAIIFTSFSQDPHVPGYACYLAGIPLRAGESKEFAGGSLTTEMRGTRDDIHQVERNLRLVEALGFAARDRQLHVEIPPEAKEAVPALLTRAGIDPSEPFILLHPGASAAARRYSASAFGAVARGLTDRGWPVLVTGTERESALLDEVLAVAPEARRLAGATSIAEYAALIERAALVICNNTLPMHLADALKTPLVVLYAGTELEEQWGPRQSPATLLRRETPCHPCHRFECPIGLPCLAIPPEDIVAAAMAQLEPLAGSAHQLATGDMTLVSASQPRRIAVLRALFLGDLLCATPALRALRTRFPDAEITLIGLPWAETLIEHVPTIDRLAIFPGWPGIPEVPYDAARTEAFLAEHRGRYDLAIQMHGSGPASNAFVAALGARHTIGYRLDGDNRLDTGLIHDPHQHEVRRWLALVAAAGATGSDPYLEFHLSPEDRRGAAALLGRREAGPLIALHAGAKDPERRWPPARFAALGDALVAKYGARLVLTGAESERDVVAAVCSRLRVSAIDLCGQTSLGAFAGVIASFDLLVTNDTGASHLAAAMATPSVVLFGPAYPEHWAPLDRDRHRVVDAASTAGPGVDRNAALAQLAVEPVLAACASHLERRRTIAEVSRKEMVCAG